MASNSWKRCSSCKKDIPFQTLYWVCNVSTCNRKRTGLSFCSVTCWDAHVPGMNHRESWAEERTSPTPAAWQAFLDGKGSDPSAPVRAKKDEEVSADSSEPVDTPEQKAARARAAAEARSRVIVRRTSG